MITQFLRSFLSSYYLPFQFTWRRLTRQLEPELLYLHKIVGTGQRAIDIGANEGIYSYFLAKFCQVVEAFEPQDCVAPLIAYRNFRKLKINIHFVALSDGHGLQSLYIPFSGGQKLKSRASLEKISPNAFCHTVPVQKLDDYDFTDVSFIKIDVEGHELSVLKGSINTIKKSRPIILIDIEQRLLLKESIQTVFDYIKNMEYEGFFLENKRWQSIEKFSHESNQLPSLLHGDKTSPFKTTKYINNLLFIPITHKKILSVILSN